MSEIENAIQKIERTIAIARNNSLEKWTERLQKLLEEAKTTNKFTQKEAFFYIGQLCHPKALGDVNVTSIDRKSWNEQLEKLHDVCAKAFNILDKQI